MKRSFCERAWQAEAIEDGRLQEADASSFERHASGCEVCANERRALLELRRLAQALPVLRSSQLEQRRQRNELLRRANELTLRKASRGFGAAWRWAASAVVLGAVAAGFWVWRADAPRGSHPAESAAIAANELVPTYQIAASEGASWRTLERSERLRLAIMRGRFELSVDKLRSDQRFVLELPDGELEVVGTRFVVATDGERTLDVRVMEGRVALRLRAQPARELSAGQAWTSAPETAASSPATPLSTAVTKHEQPQVRSVRTQHEATRGHGPISPAAAYGHAAHPKPSPGHAFAAAVAAFSAGDYGRAETLLRAFERDHPEDARVEDALFLRAIAYARQGDENQRRELASEYLKRFPRGLRRLEAERLAR